MSFDKLKVPELKKVAEDFGVDLKANATKDNIIDELSEMGVTYDMYETFENAKISQQKELEDSLPSSLPPAPKKDERTVLVKMERENGTYETYGYRFTKANPFVVVPESAADEICRNEEGFRLALPSEAAEFYR
jgi:hypothetical protein